MSEYSELKRLPLIAMQGMVVLPGMVGHIDLKKGDASEALINLLNGGGHIALATMREGLSTLEGPESVFPVGAETLIKQKVVMPDGNVRLLLEGIERIVFREINKQPNGIMMAAVSLKPVERAEFTADEEEARIRMLAEILGEYVIYQKTLPKTLLDYARNANELFPFMRILMAKIPFQAIERMSLLMHGIPYQKFTTYNEDVVAVDRFYDGDKPLLFSVQVSNPPFSQHYSASKSFENDPRYSAAGVIAPKTYEDMMFVEHVVHHMDADGRAVIILPHGVLFRGNAEAKIRRYLIEDQNVIDCVVGLPENIFHGTPIPTIMLVLRRKRNGDSGNILFIDASKHFKKEKAMNVITDADIDRVMKAYNDRKDVAKFAHVASLEEIRKNNYNLNIPRYIDTFEEEEPIDLEVVRKSVSEARERKQASLTKVNSMLRALGLKEV